MLVIRCMFLPNYNSNISVMYAVVEANRKLFLWHTKKSGGSQPRIGEMIPQRDQGSQSQKSFCATVLSMSFHLLVSVSSSTNGRYPASLILSLRWPCLPPLSGTEDWRAEPWDDRWEELKVMPHWRWQSSDGWLTYSSIVLCSMECFWRVTSSSEPLIALSELLLQLLFLLYPVLLPLNPSPGLILGES